MAESVPPIIGITGPIGSGKTTLARLLEELGFLNLEVDAIGHEMLRSPKVRAALAAAFGPGVLDPQGRICRKELGGMAFSSPDATARLNAIMHPPMIEEVQRRVRGPYPDGIRGVLINAPLLYTMGLDKMCRWIIYVRAPSDVRLNRIVTTRGLSPERARARLAAQDPEPRGDARVIFCDNDGSLENLRLWAKATLRELLGETDGATGPGRRAKSPGKEDPMTMHPAPAATLAENLEPHDGCVWENTPLTQTISELARLVDVPHCTLNGLLDGLFLVPVDEGGGAASPLSRAGNADQLTLYTSEKVLIEKSPGRTRHIHARLRTLLAEAGPARWHQIRIVHAKTAELVLDQELVGKMAMLAGPQSVAVPGKHGASREVELEAGQAMVISPPDPAPPAEFVRHLQNVFAGKPGVAGLYLFEASIGGGGSSLVVGVAPGPGLEANSLDPLWNEAMIGVEGWLDAWTCVDFLVLEDPNLAELVASTVPAIPLAR